MATRLGRWELAVVALIVAVYGVMFARTLDYEFVWDDVHEIQDNAAFDGPLSAGLTTTQTERTDAELTQLHDIVLAYDSYRPLLFASYWVDIRLWGRSARVLHASNVGLGGLAILLAWLVARRLFWERRALALVPTALFALHPAQIEAVAYISGRGDLLAGSFALAATYAALRAFAAPRVLAWAALACVAFAASLLCKEAYIGLPIAIAALAWARGEPWRRARWLLAMLAVIIGYLVLRSQLVTATSSAALGSALVALPGVWLEYARIALLPFDLSTERLHDSAFVVPGWIIMGLLAAGFAFRLRTRAPITPPVRLVLAGLAGLAWFAILLGPSAVPILSAGTVADRYLYAPLFGLACALTAGAAHLAALRRKLGWPLIAAGGLWGVLLLAVAWLHVPVWSDNRTLYANAVATTPDSSSANYRLGYLDAAAGQWDDAIPRFETAVRLDPGNIRALNNLGVGYLRTGQPALAETALARSVAANPAHFRAWLNLGLAQLEQGKHREGCAAISRALAINPKYESAQQTFATRCAH